ncbi:MAG: hypothetical protein QN162_14625 [Armatimonadota bacterium]|nr:hypothetical protein [Armatimonadota bacterium]
MSEDVIASPGVQGSSDAPAQPSQEPAPDTAAGGEQPEAQAQQGTLPPEVHPAVKAERERAKRYRQMVEAVFVLDDQGNPVDYNPNFVARLQEQLGAGAREASAADPMAAYRSQLEEWARANGFLPEQVEAIASLAEAIASRQAQEIAAPILEASIEQLKAALIQSEVVPREAAPFVARWIDRARQINPRALLTRQGRETVLRQALGEYYLQTQQARKAPGTGAPPAPPAMLRPTPGPSRSAPAAEEAQIRAKLGLPVDKYLDTGPEVR